MKDGEDERVLSAVKGLDAKLSEIATGAHIVEDQLKQFWQCLLDVTVAIKEQPNFDPEQWKATFAARLARHPATPGEARSVFLDLQCQ